MGSNGAIRPTVLVVDDDANITALLRRAFALEGYDVTTAATGPDATRELLGKAPDIIVLDVMLPGYDGVEVLRRLRAAEGDGARVPVLLLTARDEVAERVRGLDAGADDYLVKPFAVDELLARIEAVHRRTAHKPAMEIEAGGLRLSLAAKRLTIDGRTIELTPTEFSILELLMRYNGQVVTRKMLCEHVWGFDWDGPTNVIEVHINRLRGKLDKDRDDSIIRTIRGRGYALAAG